MWQTTDLLTPCFVCVLQVSRAFARSWTHVINHVVTLLGSRTVPDAKGLMCLIEAIKLAPYPQRQDRQIMKEVDIFLEEGGKYVPHTMLLFLVHICSQHAHIAVVCCIVLPSCRCYKIGMRGSLVLKAKAEHSLTCNPYIVHGCNFLRPSKACAGSCAQL